MNSKMPEISLTPIGVVHNEIKQPTRQKSTNAISEIEIDGSLAESLDNLEEFSHVIVLYWMHKSQRKAPKKVHPRGSPDLEPMGVFATRSPVRPNPIGKSTVKLLERKNNILKVQGLDAIDGTPVLDIKPYIPGYDSVDSAKAPAWMIKR
jgi:tRNA-Thr(GGU) m(6)t(6)A37 methyltransferase TsaA